MDFLSNLVHGMCSCEYSKRGFYMRQFEFLMINTRSSCIVLLSAFLIACGGGGQAPILGTPSIQPLPTGTPIVPPSPVPPPTIIIAPQVVQTFPANLIPYVTGVSTNSLITAKFSHSMNPTSLNTSFTVACPSGAPITGVVTYDAVNYLATFSNSGLFPANTTCVATISTSAVDTAATPIAANYVWRFTTASSVDLVPPTITANDPIDNATLICLSQPVSITFSKAMDSSTVNSSTFYVTDPSIVTNPSSAHMPGLITYDIPSNTATFSVTNPTGYVASTSYITTVTSGVKDSSGNSMVATKILHFATGTQACTPIVPVSLGSMASYGAFGGGAGVTNSGVNTIVNGNLGTTAACTLFTGFHDANNVYTETTLNIGKVTGNIYCAPPLPGTTESLALTTQAAADALIAFNAIAILTPMAIVGPNSGELGGLTITPGTYRPSAESFLISSGNLTLDAGGDPNAVWQFHVPSSLTVGLSATPRSVLLINGAQAKNVLWQIGSAARIEDGSTMVGTILASAGVTISTAGQTIQTTLYGRAIGLNASVTMVNTTIVSP